MWDFVKGKVKSSYKLCTPVNMLLEKQLSEIRQDLMLPINIIAIIITILHGLIRSKLGLLAAIILPSTFI